MAATPAFKPLSTLFTPKPSYPFLSIPSKPIKLSQFSISSPPSLHFSASLKKKPSVVSLVARTSDWAQQGEEENSVDEDALNWDNQPPPNGETEAIVSDWEGEGEEVAESGGEEFGDAEETYQDPPEEAKLFVGNLPYDIDSQNLAELFEKAGTVEVAEVIYNRETDQSRGFGFVTMSTVEEAEKAVEKFNRYDISGRLLTVNKAAPRGSRVERSPRVFEAACRIYVGNLPWQVDDTRLEQVFSEHGKVMESRVVYDRETGRSRGFGFVTMSSQSELEDAIAALDGQSLDGRSIRVNAAEDRPRRGAF